MSQRELSSAVSTWSGENDLAINRMTITPAASAVRIDRCNDSKLSETHVTLRIAPASCQAMDSPTPTAPDLIDVPIWRLYAYFLRLGTAGFGGPIALAGFMQRDLVETRRWISRQDYSMASPA